MDITVVRITLSTLQSLYNFFSHRQEELSRVDRSGSRRIFLPILDLV